MVFVAISVMWMFGLGCFFFGFAWGQHETERKMRRIEVEEQPVRVLIPARVYEAGMTVDDVTRQLPN